MSPQLRAWLVFWAVVGLFCFVIANTWAEAVGQLTSGKITPAQVLSQAQAKLRDAGVLGGTLELPQLGGGAAKPKGGIGGRARAAYLSGARHCRGLHPAVLAAIGKVESDHGRSRARGVHSGWNPKGAAGPMQFGIGRGKAGNAWARYGRGNVYDLEDAAAAAARKLCHDGAPRNYPRALYAYNHSRSYVARVLALARRYDREVY